MSSVNSLAKGSGKGMAIEKVKNGLMNVFTVCPANLCSRPRTPSYLRGLPQKSKHP